MITNDAWKPLEKGKRSFPTTGKHKQQFSYGNDVLELLKTGFNAHQFSGNEPTPLDIWLVIGRASSLENPKFLDYVVTKGNNLQLHWEERYIQRGKTKEEEKRPTILLLEDDVLGWQGAMSEETGDHGVYKSRISKLDRRYLFFDASIWYRMISLEGGNFFIRFRGLLEELLQHHENGLYQTISAIESLELQQRLFLNSYLVDKVDGHAKAVVPFRFHSETIMKKQASEIETTLSKHTWGSILIDDFLHRRLKGIDQTESKISKGELIQKLIDPYCEVLNYDPAQQEENSLDWLEEGEKVIRQYPKADIMILDYYLGKNDYEQENFGAKVIENFTKKGDYYGMSREWAHQKYWIFPIAVIETAYASHLKTIQDKNILSTLVLGSVVDPIATPHLFRYRFLNFLSAQLESEVRSAHEIFRYAESQLFSPNIDVRSVFKDLYPELVSGISQIRRLSKQNLGGEKGKGKSLFAESILGDQHKSKKIDSFCIHLQTLFHFIGFGTGQDEGKIIRELLRLQDAIVELKGTNSEEVKILLSIGENLIRATSKFLDSRKPA